MRKEQLGGGRERGKDAEKFGGGGKGERGGLKGGQGVTCVLQAEEGRKARESRALHDLRT